MKKDEFLKLVEENRFTENHWKDIVKAVEDNWSASEENDSHKRLDAGRHYLMGVNVADLSVQDALEAFGFGRNGLLH